jgi:ribosome-binding protein aMBF1 (putative translation factor)
MLSAASFRGHCLRRKSSGRVPFGEISNTRPAHPQRASRIRWMRTKSADGESVGASRAARSLHDWPHVKLAKLSNLRESTIKNFEAGRSVPTTNAS